MIIEEKNIAESDLLNLLNDVHFEKIQLGLRTSNIFEILKISRAEIRHSNFLGWLLDPNESHGLKELILNRVLRDIFSDELATNVSALDADSVNYHNVEIKREWQNIDILVILEDIVICIENKVDSKDHSNQLARYKTIVEDNFPKHTKVHVYLTPDGEAPSKLQDVYLPYSYFQISEHLHRLMDVYGETLSNKIHTYINDYLVVLKRTIMKNDELNDLAVKLYKNHRGTLDFIFENRPDIEQEFRLLIEEKVVESGWILGSKNKGYVRFLTPKLQEIIHKYDFANGWPLKEAFLFEIDFFWSSMKTFIFKTVIAPGEEEYIKKLTEVFENIDGTSKPPGKKWLVHFSDKRKFPLEQLSELNDEERKEEINKLWPMVEEMVARVEKGILEQKGKLK